MGDIDLKKNPPTQAVTGPLTDTQLRASDVKVSLDGEQVAVSNPQYDLKIYSDASYDYYCHAAPGSALSASAWRVRRMDADGSVTYAGGAATFVNAATNLSTVQGLFP